MIRLLLFTLTLSAILFSNVSCDVIGCGGWVKANPKVDFSKIAIQLFSIDKSSNEQSLKYDGVPLPHGYYTIPVYSHGSYLLKLIPPPGWFFNPSQYELEIDGVSDLCSEHHDLNFELVGFGLTGHILFSADDLSKGPEGLVVQLFSVAESSEPVVSQAAHTDSNGFYSFAKPVAPGKYLVKPQHFSWTFSNPLEGVVVNFPDDETPNIIVTGYDATGSITDDDDKPLSNAIITLTSNDKSIGDQEATTDSQGRFQFLNLASGTSYTVTPSYGSTKGIHQIEPSHSSFTVKQSSVTVPHFKLTGFRVAGKITAGSKGLAGVKVTAELPGGLVRNAVTNDKGEYTLDNMKSREGIVEVQFDQYKFDPLKVSFSATQSVLADISPSAYQLCAKVHLNAVSDLARVKVSFLPVNPSSANLDKPRVTRNDADSSISHCLFVANGDYKIAAQIPGSDIQLSPAFHDVSVKNAPIGFVTFSQFTTKLEYNVVCIDADTCPPSKIALKRASDGKVWRNDIFKASRPGVFEDLGAGEYVISVENPLACFEESTQGVKLSLSDKDKPVRVVFQQTAWKWSVSSSHALSFTAKHAKSGKSISVNLKGDASDFTPVCLPEKGDYSIDVADKYSCLEFSPALPSTISIPRDITTPKHLGLTKLMVDIAFTTSDKELNLAKLVDHEGTPLITAKAVLASGSIDVIDTKFSKPKSAWTLRLEIPKAGGKLSITPDFTSVLNPYVADMLFSPSTADFEIASSSVSADITCPLVKAGFSLVRGVWFEGSTSPAIADVSVTLVDKATGETRDATQTDQRGRYRFGPFASKADFAAWSVTFAKPGFFFSPVGAQDAKAVQLAQIKVNVFDDQGKPLPKVLISMSSDAAFRKNAGTDDKGELVLLGLEPAKYFVRPMLKEYVFEPETFQIDLVQGQQKSVKIQAKRTLFSVPGTVKTLNGRLESGVKVLALPEEGQGGACASKVVEEDVSGSDGTFNIRGLQPGCRYQITLGSGILSLPPSNLVTMAKSDSDPLTFISLPSPTGPTFSLTVSGRLPNADGLDALLKRLRNTVGDNTPGPVPRVSLYRASSSANPLQTAPLNLPEKPISLEATTSHPISAFFFFRPISSSVNESFLIRLEGLPSTLMCHRGSMRCQGNDLEVQFGATSSSSVFVNLGDDLVDVLIDANDQSSMVSDDHKDGPLGSRSLAPILLASLVFLIFKIDSVIWFVANFPDMLQDWQKLLQDWTTNLANRNAVGTSAAKSSSPRSTAGGGGSAAFIVQERHPGGAILSARGSANSLSAQGSSHSTSGSSGSSQKAKSKKIS